MSILELGAASSMVQGVKGDAETDYRTGNVNITPANIGAQPAGNYAGSSSDGGAANSLANFIVHNTAGQNCNTLETNAVSYYTSNGPSTGIGATTTDGALYMQKYNSSWQAQIAQDYRTGSIFVRGKNNGTWQDWKYITEGSRRSVSGSSHAEALKAYFNSYKSNTPRNNLVSFYSSAYGNGSQAFGYFLSGYDSNPYGGFFVAHYNNPKYVGIQNGTYTEWTLSKDGHTHNYMPKTTSLYYNSSGTNGTVTLSASAANYNHMRFYIRDNNNHNVGDFTIASRVNGYVITLNTSWADTGGQTTKVKRGTLSGTTFTPSEYHTAGIRGGPSMAATNNNEIYIYRVEGWNE